KLLNLIELFFKNQDFVKVSFEDIEALKFGTLYILDRFNNVIAFNHPNINDYYVYDATKKGYILGDDELNPHGELMNFSDYKMLNTDQDILKTKGVSALLNSLTSQGVEDMIYAENQSKNIFVKKNYIEYKGQNYLAIVQYGEQTETKYIYFHPVKQFQKPVFEIISIILIMTFIVIILIIFISFLFSRTFTNPINILVDATKIIASGDYNHLTKVNSTDEIGDLSQNFNQMIKNIKLYQDKLLSSEREKSELELASRIQTCLLPAIPDREFYEITATMIPAAEVGGDYYDLIGEANGRIWFGIGDVSGHGLTSGLIMMMAQTAFNTILLNDPTVSSDKLIAQVNKVMYQNIKQRLGEDHFMTLSFMVANQDGTVRFSGAHLDVLVYRTKTKKVERVSTSGVWLGLIPDIFENTVEKEFKLDTNDLMLLYTDGL
ncbi:MAG TPA: SpoIIE family protein phosphatase, partial [Spirochaetota bacterium]|nr:SpoIIE family protein phosphatase [Spirochaetota bacterium]